MYYQLCGIDVIFFLREWTLRVENGARDEALAAAAKRTSPKQDPPIRKYLQVHNNTGS